MFFGFPWALIALTVLPACLAIYFFQRRTREVQVSALFLWQAPESNFYQGRRVERFRAPWRALLELLILAVLILAASDLRVQTGVLSRPTWLILDDSWSMQPFYRSARKELLEYWKQQKSGYPVHIVYMGEQPKSVPECPDFAAFSRELALWNPRQQTAQRAAALQFAVQAGSSVCAQTGKEPDFWIVCDHVETEFLEQNPQIRFWSVGKQTDNAAWIQCVRSSEGAGRDCVRAQLVNASGAKQKLTIKVDQFNRFSGSKPISPLVKPIQSETLTAQLNPGDSTTFAVIVESNRILRWTLPDDAIRYDNTVWSFPSPERIIKSKVAVANPSVEQRIRKALTLAQTGAVRLRFIDSTTAETPPASAPAPAPTPTSASASPQTPASAPDPVSNEPADLLITDSLSQISAQSVSPTGWIVLFCKDNPPQAAPSVPSGAPSVAPKNVDSSNPSNLVSYSGPYLSKSDSFLTGTDFRTVLWTTTESSETLDRQMAHGETFLAVGNTALITDDWQPTGRRIVRFRLCPEYSNLLNTPNWPIISANLISERAKSLPGLDKSNVAQGENVSLFGLSDQRRFAVSSWDNDGNSQKTVLSQSIQGRCVFRPSLAGLYRLESPPETSSNSPTGPYWAAVNPINAAESDVRNCTPIKRDPVKTEERLTKEFVPLQVPLLLFALILSGVHLYLCSRKRTRISSV